MAGCIHLPEAGFTMGLRSIGEWVIGQIVQDVPEDVGLCEFDCRRNDCLPGELESCHRRRHRAVGELMPGMLHVRASIIIEQEQLTAGL